MVVEQEERMVEEQEERKGGRMVKHELGEKDEEGGLKRFERRSKAQARQALEESLASKLAMEVRHSKDC